MGQPHDDDELARLRTRGGRRCAAALLADLAADVRVGPAVDGLDDLEDRDVAGGAGETESATRPGGRGEHAMAHELRELLRQIWRRDAEVLGELAGADRLAVG